MSQNSNHFDINILEDALKQPSIPLSFPLPYDDQETIVPSEANVKMANNFGILGNFVRYFTNINYEDIYGTNEYKYSINKHSTQFNQSLRDYMNDRLSKTDEKLDQIVYKLIDQELRMNLIKAKDFPLRFKQVKQFMIEYYQRENEVNMPHYPHNLKFLRVAYITVMKTLGKMFPRGIWVNKEQFESLYQKYLANPMSIIFLPNHQSHVDYIIIHLITIRFHMSIPTVIAGENLNVAIFGKFLKNLGAIFIKRSFNNELYTERNLENLIQFVILNKIHLEVFIEGTRSRDGKLLLPKYGILKTLSRVYHQDPQRADMLLQPLAITYERIYEADGYFDELSGKDKKQESSINIIKNGLSNLFYGVDKDDLPHDDINRDYDNTHKTLHGKIFVVLGHSFTFSSFLAESKSVSAVVGGGANGNGGGADEEEIEQGVNLKKLGFKILHEINRIHYIPPVGIVGCAIQIYYYLHNSKQFGVREVIPIFRLIVRELSREHTSRINMEMFHHLLGMNDDEVIGLFHNQMQKFFRFIKFSTDEQIQIDNSIELLYYKNLTIHLIIHKCLVCFILWNTSDVKRMNQLYYVFTGFLKHDFLFDHNYNERNELNNILVELKQQGVIDEKYGVVDAEYITYMVLLIKPFIESYTNCVEYLNICRSSSFKNIGRPISETQIINDQLLNRDYPTTKMLLKMIQSKRGEEDHIESVNKQYLLSCLFYLANLKLIKIFKNKQKTKAFVILERVDDLQVTHGFLSKVLRGDGGKVEQAKMDYMIDIIDKQFDRQLPLVSKL